MFTHQANVDHILESLFYKTHNIDDVGHGAEDINEQSQCSVEDPNENMQQLVADQIIRGYIQHVYKLRTIIWREYVYLCKHICPTYDVCHFI